MTGDEIRPLQRAAQHAADRKLHIWSTFSDELRFDARLLYRRPSREGAPKLDPKGDRGPLTMPKVFRRLAACHAALGRVGRSAIAAYVEAHASRDWWFLTSEFLEQGAAASQPRPLADVIRGHRLLKRPDQFVFRKQRSCVLRADGRRVVSWLA